MVLRGAEGNPSAVGARVTLELSSGGTQTGELYAGSGYYGRSSATCFFGYPATNPPRKIRVRWPSGVTTSQEARSVGPIVGLTPTSP